MAVKQIRNEDDYSADSEEGASDNEGKGTKFMDGASKFGVKPMKSASKKKVEDSRMTGK